MHICKNRRIIDNDRIMRYGLFVKRKRKGAPAISEQHIKGNNNTTNHNETVNMWLILVPFPLMGVRSMLGSQPVKAAVPQWYS